MVFGSLLHSDKPPAKAPVVFRVLLATKLRKARKTLRSGELRKRAKKKAEVLFFCWKRGADKSISDILLDF